MKILFQRNIAIKATASLLLLLCINALGLVSYAGNQTITGKVVGRDVSNSIAMTARLYAAAESRQ